MKDVKRAREFFSSLGFAINEQGSSPHSVAVMIGTKKVPVMMFEESIFKGFTQQEITDTSRSSEVMLSFDAESREEVDEIARKAEAAGGNVFGKPSDVQGWMYGCGFTDLDGHRWNALFMDMSKQ